MHSDQQRSVDSSLPRAVLIKPSCASGEKCPFGDACCYGHKCPYSTRCFYFKAGTCRFVGGTLIQFGLFRLTLISSIKPACTRSNHLSSRDSPTMSVAKKKWYHLVSCLLQIVYICVPYKYYCCLSATQLSKRRRPVLRGPE